MIEIKDGQIHVECRYTAKVGRANYSSEECSMTFGVTYAATGTDGELLAQAGQLEDTIMQSLKLGVGTELVIPIKASPDGPRFDFNALKPPPAALVVPTPAPAPQPTAQAAYPQSPPAAGAGGGQFAPPKASKEQVAVLPRFQADFGAGLQTYIDQRPLKQSPENPNAPYSARAPDFKNAVNGEDKYWLTGSNGNVNHQVQAGLTAAQAAPAVDPMEVPF
jgi:hypothetical protein